MKKVTIFAISIMLILITAAFVSADLNVTLLTPTNGTETNNNTINFSCNVSEDNVSLSLTNVTLYVWNSTSDLYTNFSEISGTQNDNITFWSIQLADDNFEWNCNVSNNGSVTALAASNYTLTVDTTNPVISEITINDSYLYTSQVIEYIVNVSDESNSTIASVVAEGNSLAWNGTYWIGTGAVDNDEVVNVTVIDAAGNNITNNSVTYTVDNTSPVLTVAMINNTNLSLSPNITHENGTVTFNWTINETGLNYTNLSIDSGVIYNSSTDVGPNIFTTNVSTGIHTVTITSYDNAGNSDISGPYTFIINRQENVTDLMQIIINSNPGVITNSSLKNSSGSDLSGNNWLNQTLILDMDINVSGISGSVEIINFSGLDANWNQTDFVSIVNTSGSLANTIINNAGTNLSDLILFINATQFLNQTDFGAGVKIFINRTLGSLDMLYFDDDDGGDVYKITTICVNNESGPGANITLSNMCYYNASSNVTIWIPHLSGAGLGNDTAVPRITVNVPGATLDNSYFKFNITVNEINPISSGTFCWFILNTSGVQYNISASNFSTVANNTYNYVQLTHVFYNLSNGAYNITVNCTDSSNNSAVNQTLFTLTDTTAPAVTFASATSIDTTSADIVVTANYTYDLINYSIRIGTVNTSLSTSENSSIYSTSHTIELSGLSNDTRYYYNITSCDINAKCTHSGIKNFATTDDESSSSSSSDSNNNYASSYWQATFSTSVYDLEQGFYKIIGYKQRMRIRVNDSEHYIGIVEIDNNSATINVSSITQQQVFNIGDTYKFDVIEDGYYDLSITLDDINNSKANLYTILIHELVPESIGEPEPTNGTNISEPLNTTTTDPNQIVITEESSEQEKQKGSTNWLLLVLIIVGLIVVIFLLVGGKKKRY